MTCVKLLAVWKLRGSCSSLGATKTLAGTKEQVRPRWDLRSSASLINTPNYVEVNRVMSAGPIQNQCGFKAGVIAGLEGPQFITRVPYSAPDWVLYFQHRQHSSFCDKMFSKHLHLRDEVILSLSHQQRKVCQFIKGVTSEIQMMWLLRWLNLFIIDYKLSSSTRTWIDTLQLCFSDDKWNGHFSNCSFAEVKLLITCSTLTLQRAWGKINTL